MKGWLNMEPDKEVRSIHDSDLISREAVLQSMDDWLCDFPEWEHTSGYRRGFERAMAIVKTIPAMQPPKHQNKHGFLQKIFGGKNHGDG